MLKNERLEEVINLAERTGRKILEIYQKEYKSWRKKDRSLFTEADLAAQDIILSGLKKYNYGILSEENKDNLSRLKKEKVWIIDPLDGTRDFLEKTGEFSIMIGLAYKGKPVLGVVYRPVDDIVYFAEKEKGAFIKRKNRSLKQLKVSDISDFFNARFVVSRFHLSDKEKEFLKNNKIQNIKYVGSAGIKIGMVAEGKADAYISFSDKTSQWDTCAPEIILREAGGEMSDLNGKSFVYNRRELRNLYGLVVSNGKIHNQIIKNIIKNEFE